jgi:hypothetical protein
VEIVKVQVEPREDRRLKSEHACTGPICNDSCVSVGEGVGSAFVNFPKSLRIVGALALVHEAGGGLGACVTRIEPRRGRVTGECNGRGAGSAATGV